MKHSRAFTLMVLLVVMSLIPLPATVLAQDGLTPVISLLDQAQIALDNGDLATAQSLLIGASALMTPELQATCDTLPGAKILLDQAASAVDVPTASTLLTSARALIDNCRGGAVVVDTPPLASDYQGITAANAAQVQALLVLDGHTDSVGALTWSPDGTQLASGSYDQTVRVWDAASGTQVAIFQENNDRVSEVSWSSDGTRLASGSGDGTLRIWDAASSTQIMVIDNNSWVRTIAFSPDGTRLASSSDDGNVRVWDVASGTQLSVMTGHTDLVFDVVWSPDGTMLASGSGDSTVRVWEQASGSQIAVLNGHSDSVLDVAWSPDGTTIASGSRDNTLRLWDAASGTELAVLRDHTDSVVTVAFSPDSTLLASGSGDRTLRIWDVANGTQLAVLRDHADGIWGVAWSPDGTQIATTSVDRTVRIWGLPEPGTVIPTESAPVTDDTVYPLVVIGETEGEVVVGSTQTWSYQGQAGEELTVSTVAEWDTTLMLMQGGYEIAFNDDGGGLPNYNSEISITLPETATYTIVVGSYLNESGGEYTLVIESAESEAADAEDYGDEDAEAEDTEDEDEYTDEAPAEGDFTEREEAESETYDREGDEAEDEYEDEAPAEGDYADDAPADDEYYGDEAEDEYADEAPAEGDYEDEAEGYTIADSDGDGVADAVDLCPGQDDSVDFDGDGIADCVDFIIDSDGDGVADAEDLCPAEAGPASANGCPEEAEDYEEEASAESDFAEEAADEYAEAEETEAPAEADTIPFSTSLFTFEYPAPLLLEPFPSDEGDSVTLGSDPIGWLWPVFSLPVEPEEDNRGQWGINILFLDLGTAPTSPTSMLNTVLDGGFRDDNPDTIFGNVRTDTIGRYDVAYVDYIGEGRRLIMFNPGGTYVGIVFLFAHPDEVDTQYEVVQPIIDSVELR
ncbi:MAG: WD40 repeat domain-containing protein [Chloroflexi bacterium]|nr:WD40 repeat domain-containing protein [Chloroflexota bacterium]